MWMINECLKWVMKFFKKDFCVQIGYNHRAVKNYSECSEQVKDLDVSRTEVSTPTRNKPRLHKPCGL